MKHLIRQIAQDRLWNQWVEANSAGEPTVDAGCISGPAKDGCISSAVKAGCISGPAKAGCISSKAGCIS